jgi:predicted ribosomally synthesized peptide with nif11-like leader
MSKKDALNFLKQIAENHELMDAVKSAGQDGVLKMSEKMGYCVTMEELIAVSREIKGIKGELSDDQLDIVTGGLSTREISDWALNNIKQLNSLYKNLF